MALSFLPLVFLLLTTVAVRHCFSTWRAALVFAAVVTGGVLTALTETLSLVHAFSFFPLAAAWSMAALAAGIKGRSRWKQLSWPIVDAGLWPLGDKLLLFSIIFILAITALTAAVSAPNTWDSMTYHLARVQHWIQNRGVGFYPTSILRQLYSPPWAEFAVAHLRILGAGETGPNAVQWACMAGSLATVSLIAGQLGASRRGQLLAANLLACLPMGILQAVSTQTDYVCGFWTAVFVFFLIELKRAFSGKTMMAAGFSLGLALLSKGNGYIFALPFLVWFMVPATKQGSLRQAKTVLILIACAVILNMGQYLRNSLMFGSPAWTDVSLINSTFNLGVLWVNILRNIGIHLATPLLTVNENTAGLLAKIAHWLGTDINDPRTFFGADRFTISTMILDEDYAGNLLHALLFAAVFIIAWFYRPALKSRFYIAALASSFLLFCLVLRFQPWHSRFHLPLFILFAPPAAMILESLLKRLSVVLGIVLLVMALPWLFLNDQHPWVGGLSIWKQPKSVQYFYKRPQLALPSLQIASHIKEMGCRDVGLITGSDDWEYPWWVLLNPRRIEQVNVANISGKLKYPLGDFRPCIVISSVNPSGPFLAISGRPYGLVGSLPSASLSVYTAIKEQ